MNKTILLSLFTLTLSTTPFAIGCSNDAGAPVEASEEQAVIAQSDAALKKELANAIVGLETSGSEGEPDPYKVVDLKLRRGEAMTDEILLNRLLPKLQGVARNEDLIPGLDEKPIAEAWADLIAEPNADDFDAPQELEAAKQTAAKWRTVKQIFETKLTNVKYFDMGYKSSPTGSLETGAVAHVFIGQSSTGRLIAIWGIDIWT